MCCNTHFAKISKAVSVDEIADTVILYTSFVHLSANFPAQTFSKQSDEISSLFMSLPSAHCELIAPNHIKIHFIDESQITETLHSGCIALTGQITIAGLRLKTPCSVFTRLIVVLSYSDIFANRFLSLQNQNYKLFITLWPKILSKNIIRTWYSNNLLNFNNVNISNFVKCLSSSTDALSAVTRLCRNGAFRR